MWMLFSSSLSNDKLKIEVTNTREGEQMLQK